MPDQSVAAIGAIITREAAARIVERTDLPLKLIDEEENDPIGMLAAMLEGNVRGFSRRRQAARAPTSAELRDYFERVDSAATNLIAALGLSVDLHDEGDWPSCRHDIAGRGRRWAPSLAPSQPWDIAWQWIDNPPGAQHQTDINKRLFRVLQEARRQRRRFATAKVTTRGPDHDQRWLIRDLAGIFAVAFGTRPTVTRQGPFVRFVLAYAEAIERQATLPPLSSDAIVEVLKLSKRRK